MMPLMMLVLVTVVTVVVGVVRGSRWRHPAEALRVGLAAMFAMTGVSHFVGMRETMVEMVPPWLPAPELLVTATGVLEIVGALALLHPRTARWSAAGLTVLLVVMFPANVHLALTGADLPWDDQLVPRTVLQLVFLAATVTVFRGGPSRAGSRDADADATSVRGTQLT
ncbi:DoxX family protein [Pseudonocardia parietis]|uniref:Membrane protein n=1 Tax=Pseudonocardia parietis TaxID=570936 RepID=A0ABS4VTK6_9PSEU|nr:DoxX family membrane protein [Pseudonocardia parietis]MBP2367252.1 putative membrane protein [Pseudonocardia parietis]